MENESLSATLGLTTRQRKNNSEDGLDGFWWRRSGIYELIWEAWAQVSMSMRDGDAAIFFFC